MIAKIINDKRKIIALFSPTGETLARVGHDTTAIEPYEENGQMAAVTWFAAFHGEVITDRINGASVGMVQYDREEL